MQTATVDISDVTPHPDNPRKGDREAIAASLNEHGQLRPLVVQRSTGHILVGNNTYLAARDNLGWTTIDVVYRDVDDDQAARIMVVDNRTSDLAEYDDDALASLLSSFEGDLAGTGFDSGEVDALLSQVDFGPLYDPFHPAEPEPAPPTPAVPAPRPVNPFPVPGAPAPAPEPEPVSEPAPAPEPEPVSPPRAAAPAAPVVTPVKMTLAYLPDDHHEVLTLIEAVRSVLGRELDVPEVVLRAVRTLVAAVDARHNPDSTVTVAELLTAAS